MERAASLRPSSAHETDRLVLTPAGEAALALHLVRGMIVSHLVYDAGWAPRGLADGSSITGPGVDAWRERGGHA